MHLPSIHFSILLIIALTLLCFLHHAQALHPPFDNSTDKKALLSFKSFIVSDPYRVLNSWQPNTSLCLWHGVTCNPNKQRVIGLTLTNYSLVGTFTSHITNLSFLQTLFLDYNSFSGTIPIEIHRLSRLRVLNLNFNNIQGTIPSSLSGCSRLQIIMLSYNHLRGSIPSELGSLSELHFLDFGNNNLSGVIPSSFGNLSSLTRLFLLSNNIQGSIPPEFGRLSSLTDLQLAMNKISGGIPNQILNVSSMLYLALAGNQLSGTVPSNLFTAFPKIRMLLLGNNSFHGYIPVSLSNATRLELLDLALNRFYGKVPLFWKLRNLQILSLGQNELTSEGIDGLDFITSLTNSTLLQIFYVNDNLLTGQLPSSIGNLSSQLFRLQMAVNRFSGNMPHEVGNLVGLTELILQENFFTGKIPSSIGNLKKLQVLRLSANFLSGSIPEMFGNLSNLFDLQLSNNNITGGIPRTLSNCQRLQSLYLAETGISGSLPKEIFSLTSLTTIQISSNNLVGTLPSEIGQLETVQQLNISKNNLSGTLPSALGDCSNLVYLDMSGNSFQGPIPSSLTKLKGIEHIDLSSNTLSGKIPPFDSLQFLKYLNLSYNKLQGEVPKNGIFLNSSAVSLIGNIDLCGGIVEFGLPKCIASKSHSNGLRKNKRFIGGLIAGAAIISISMVLCFLLMKKRKKLNSAAEEVISFEGPHKSYSYYELKTATGNFSESNLIGKGSFGSVYKGVMRDGTSVAVKVLNLNQNGANKSFLAECEAFRNIRHRNLLKIVSACSNPNFKALVLQFMTNGSLETWIHIQKERGLQKLSLKQRINIVIDIASALVYLHHECEIPIVHCDIKPSNVLLDENMMAHLGDFGIATMLQNNDISSNHHESTTIGLKGSIGYIAPEYGFGVQVTTRGDVYSYGILLLEMFTERKPTDEMFDRELNLQKWTIANLPNVVEEIFNEELKEISDVHAPDHLMALMKVGLECGSESPQERPEMKDVVVSIKKIRDLLFKKTSPSQVYQG